MCTGLKTAFRPSLETCEARIVAAGGTVAAAAHHLAVRVDTHHAAHTARHPAHPANQVAAEPVGHPIPPSRIVANTTNQAWIKLVNMTGQDLSYQLKLAPYAGGQFLPFDIAAGATQYRYSSLIANGQRVKADFAIQFDNGPITPLNTGISAQGARGYYIFLDGNGQYYVSPFTLRPTG